MKRTAWLSEFGPALSVTALILVLAPGMGVVRPLLARLLGERYVAALLVAFGVSVLAVGGAAIRPMARMLRERRGLLRVALLLLGPAVITAQQLLSERGTPAEAAVERAHIVLYGALTLLFMHALYRYRQRTATAPPGLEVALVALVLVGLVAFLDEGIQWLLAIRTGELYDVLFNLFCAVAAALSGVAWFGLRPTIELGTLTPLVTVAAALLPVSAAAFLDLAHLGYVISDPELGSFRSYYTASDLPGVNRGRGERWRDDPPNRPFRLGDLEDPYQTEAAWHVRMRNQALTDGLDELAWRENQILERYYDAFLALRYDDPRYHYPLDEETRSRLATAFADRPWPGYESGAHGLIWVWPPRWLVWVVAITATFFVVVLGGTRLRRSR